MADDAIPYDDVENDDEDEWNNILSDDDAINTVAEEITSCVTKLALDDQVHVLYCTLQAMSCNRLDVNGNALFSKSNTFNTMLKQLLEMPAAYDETHETKAAVCKLRYATFDLLTNFSKMLKDWSGHNPMEESETSAPQPENASVLYAFCSRVCMLVKQGSFGLLQMPALLANTTSEESENALMNSQRNILDGSLKTVYFVGQYLTSFAEWMVNQSTVPKWIYSLFRFVRSRFLVETIVYTICDPKHRADMIRLAIGRQSKSTNYSALSSQVSAALLSESTQSRYFESVFVKAYMFNVLVDMLTALLVDVHARIQFLKDNNLDSKAAVLSRFAVELHERKASIVNNPQYRTLFVDDHKKTGNKIYAGDLVSRSSWNSKNQNYSSAIDDLVFFGFVDPKHGIMKNTKLDYLLLADHIFAHQPLSHSTCICQMPDGKMYSLYKFASLLIGPGDDDLCKQWTFSTAVGCALTSVTLESIRCRLDHISSAKTELPHVANLIRSIIPKFLPKTKACFVGTDARFNCNTMINSLLRTVHDEASNEAAQKVHNAVDYIAYTPRTTKKNGKQTNASGEFRMRPVMELAIVPIGKEDYDKLLTKNRQITPAKKHMFQTCLSNYLSQCSFAVWNQVLPNEFIFAGSESASMSTHIAKLSNIDNVTITFGKRKQNNDDVEKLDKNTYFVKHIVSMMPVISLLVPYSVFRAARSTLQHYQLKYAQEGATGYMHPSNQKSFPTCNEVNRVFKHHLLDFVKQDLMGHCMLPCVQQLVLSMNEGGWTQYLRYCSNHDDNVTKPIIEKQQDQVYYKKHCVEQHVAENVDVAEETFREIPNADCIPPIEEIVNSPQPTLLVLAAHSLPPVQE